MEYVGENPVMINSLSVDDVFVDDYRKFCANYLENVKKIAPPQATYEALPDDGGHKCVLQGILSGVPFVANRKMVVTYYPKEDGDDFVMMISSKHNEHLVAANKDKIPEEDVISSLDINYMRFSPKFDSCGDIVGTEIKQCVITNPNGSLVDALKTKLS